MSSQDQQQSTGDQTQRLDDPELGSGVRDTGKDAPEPGEGDRPVGTVDEDANPPLSDPTKSDVYGGTGELPPKDTGAAIPPYEGRKQSATEGSTTKGEDGANVGGATGPVTDPDYKSSSPAATTGGATKSPADEQPASQAPESDTDDDGVGPSHTPGARRGEDRS
jgi:hypothetical protein